MSVSLPKERFYPGHEEHDTILKRIPRGQDQDFRGRHKLALNDRLQSGP